VNERDEGDDRLSGLMEAYQEGNLAAFEELYVALAPQLLRYLTSLCRDRTRAEDLLQNTFLHLHKARATYLPGRPVRPWAYAIARNVFLMFARASGRRGRHEVVAPEELPELPVPAEMESYADRDAVRRAVALLPQERREPLLLHHVLGLSFREVGAVLGISEGAAKVKAHRAVTALREILDVSGGGQ
jgi:RNA polymerase sigma-70 factor (ECF subfamily)